MNAERYISSAQQAVLAVYAALSERPLASVTAAELARLCGLSRDQAFRACCNLGHARLAAQGADGTWRLTHRAVALSERVRDALMARHIAEGDSP